MTVRIIGEIDAGSHSKGSPRNDGLPDVPRYTPAGSEVTGPIVLRL